MKIVCLTNHWLISCLRLKLSFPPQDSNLYPLAMRKIIFISNLLFQTMKDYKQSTDIFVKISYSANLNVSLSYDIHSFKIPF